MSDGVILHLYTEVMISISDSRREGLKLPLNRSLSEPGVQVHATAMPTKKFKLESSVSLPSSPNGESTTFRSVIKCVRTMRPSDLAKRLMNRTNAFHGNNNNSNNTNNNVVGSASSVMQQRSRRSSFLVLDCRPFIAYNLSHVQSAINVNCADRFNRKRLQGGRASLSDLATTKEGKDLLRKKTHKEVIVYDDSTSELESITTNHALFLVFAALWEENQEPVLLKGGWKEFYNGYKDLCESSSLRIGRGDSLSPEPPTPMEEGAIENAPATRVLPFLFLGNERDASDLERLVKLDISCILNVTAHLPGYHQDRGIKYKRLPASDSGHQNLKQYFEEAFEFIDAARKSESNILIHCQAGVSRSPTITIAYIMKHTLMTMVEAYRLVKAKRPIISPNFNFMGQLLEFEQNLRSTAPSEPECKPCRQCVWTNSELAACSSTCSV